MTDVAADEPMSSQELVAYARACRSWVTPPRPKGRGFGGAVHATLLSMLCMVGFTEPPSALRL